MGQTSKTRKQLDPAKTRDSIMRAAFKVFSDKGYKGASIGDIAQAAAPSAANAPWMLFRTTSNGGAGILNGISYVQCVYTHAGQAPAARPQRSGQVSEVPYVAQYWFYR